MNLLQDPFLTARLRSGKYKSIVLHEISDPDIVDLVLPRVDFYNAAYQFVIAVLQTVFAPKKSKQWHDYYINPPSQTELATAFEQIAHAFHMKGDGPLFMQEFDPTPVDKKPTSIANLLFGSPGEQTVKQNADHFVKQDFCQQLSLPMAALALWTMQIYAPSGGQGHRTSIRGGGPMTTLVLPQDEQASFWHKIWMNVLSREDFAPNRYDDPDFQSCQLFPWLGATRTSKKPGSEVYAHEVHFLHVYWAMPRRVRFKVEATPGACSLTGEQQSYLIKEYITIPHGYNYSGSWGHPLTPYRIESEQEQKKRDQTQPPKDNLSIKGQPGGIHYTHWPVFTALDKKSGQQAATVVEKYISTRRYRAIKKLDSEGRNPRLWAFALDADNMKIRCWYEGYMPLYDYPPEKRDIFLEEVKAITAVTQSAILACRRQMRYLWNCDPKKDKALHVIDLKILNGTEQVFYQVLTHLAFDESKALNETWAKHWLKHVQNYAVSVFDELALTGDDRYMISAMEKITRHRRFLWVALHSLDAIKKFKERYFQQEEA